MVENNNQLGIPLSIFVAIRALPVGLLLMVIAGVGLYYHQALVTERYRTEHHAVTAEHIHRTLTATLAATANQLKAIATSDVFRNALVDFSRRDDYLPLFIDSVALAGFQDVPLLLVDYRGKPIYANSVPGSDALIDESGWQSQTLKDGKEFTVWGAGGFLIAEPVMSHGEAEAVLIGKLLPHHIQSMVQLLRSQDEFILVDTEDSIVYSSVPNVFPTGTAFRDVTPLGWHASAGTTMARLKLRIFTLEDLSQENDFEDQMGLFFLVAILCLVLTSLGIIGATGRGVRLPLLRLSDTISSIIGESAATQLAIRASLDSATPKEFNKLALLFNTLLDKVEMTTTSRDEVSGILQSLSEILIVTDDEGKITWSNKAHQIFMLQIGMQTSEYLYERRLWQDQPADIVHATIEIPYPLKETESESEDSVLIILWSRTVLADEQGVKKGYVYTGQDVTQTRQVEHELRLEQKTLERARVEAELANESKSRFLATMSHEIRTPINGVLGMTRLLLSSDLSNKQLTQAQLVESSALSLLTILNDILDFSKIEANKLEVESESFDLPKVLSDCTQTLTLSAHQKGVELVLDLNGIDQRRLKGDAIRIKQVVINLCSNAIKFTEKGYVLVRATLSPSFDRRRMLTINVQDTGIGIEADKLGSLFDAFQQADVSTTRRFGGTGLGLAISRQLCRLMGGDIFVSSEYGKGSIFTAFVELSSDVYYESALPEPILAGLKALVVDAVPPSLKAVVDAVSILGAETTEAESGDAALAVCQSPQSPQFDCLLIDDNIPDHQVQALVQSLDETRGLENVVVVLLGDIIKDFNEDNLADQQIDGFCIKPVSAAVLMSAFRPFLTKNTGEDLPLIVVKNRAKTDAQAVRPKGVSQVPVIAATSSASAGLAPAKQPQSSDAVGSLSSGPGNASSLEPFKCRILLVDDNEVNQVVGLGILEEVGLTADTACDGQEAIACLKVAAEEGAPYDLVLMDCQMPVMDGFTATENIRAGAAGPSVVEVPIIAMTANAMQGDREKCLAAGMTDYLAKPVEPDELVGALNKLLGCALSL